MRDRAATASETPSHRHCSGSTSPCTAPRDRSGARPMPTYSATPGTSAGSGSAMPSGGQHESEQVAE